MQRILLNVHWSGSKTHTGKGEGQADEGEIPELLEPFPLGLFDRIWPEYVVEQGYRKVARL